MNLQNTLTIANTLIRHDIDGRYCLNDLHKAAGGEQRHRPSRWLENQQAQELAQEIGKAGIPALVSVKGGTAPGTYVCKELVYAYAMWISPVFSLKVIRAYDALVTPGLPTPTTEAAPPAMLTPEQYESERRRLAVLMDRLQSTPIVVMPEEYERLTGERIKVGKRTYMTVDLVGTLEDCGVPRDAIKKILGADSNYVRQYAFLARKSKSV